MTDTATLATGIAFGRSPGGTVEARRRRGRARRRTVPRSSHAAWAPGPDRPDPVVLLEEQNADRLRWLVPVRRGRMAVSAFAFYPARPASWPPTWRRRRRQG